MDLPKKLKRDAIIEALLEVRFECDESQHLPEAIVATLASSVSSSSFNRVRTPIADMPAIVRDQDPNLKHQATIEFRANDGSKLVRIGPWVFSTHERGVYPGWDNFRADLEEKLDLLFSKFTNFRATRFGLRYINGLSGADHLVKSVYDLELKISVGNEELSSPVNVAFHSEPSSDVWSTTRVASPEFLKGAEGRPISAVVDVDVFTPDGYICDSKEDALDWLDRAHEHEKKQFFMLLPQSVIEALRMD